MTALIEHDSGVATFDSEGYSWREWLPVLRAFENHENLQRTSGTVCLEQFLSQQENRTGSDLVYEIKSTGGEFQLEYSPFRRTEKGQMLWGTLSFNGDLDGEILSETRQQVVSAGAIGYLEPVNGYTDLAEITIPGSYDQDQLVKSIQAGIAVATDVEELETQVKETIRDYEPSI